MNHDALVHLSAHPKLGEIWFIHGMCSKLGSYRHGYLVSMLLSTCEGARYCNPGLGRPHSKIHNNGAKVPAVPKDTAGKRPSKAALPESALQRRPSVIEPGGLEGGFESGILKWGLKGGFFTVLVSQNSRNFYGNFHLQPVCVSIYCSDSGKGEHWCYIISFLCYTLLSFPIILFFSFLPTVFKRRCLPCLPFILEGIL